MPKKIHLGSATFHLPDSADQVQIVQDVMHALETGKPVHIQAEYEGHGLSIVLNGARIDFVVLEWDGTIKGFSSG